MKKYLLFLSFLVITFISVDAQQKVIPLYDGPVPGSESWNWNEAENDNNSWQTKVVYNVTKPTLQFLYLRQAKRMAPQLS